MTSPCEVCGSVYGCTEMQHTTAELKTAQAAGRERGIIQRELAYREDKMIRQATLLLQGISAPYCDRCFCPYLTWNTPGILNLDEPEPATTLNAACARCKKALPYRRIHTR